jgi:hypothetical protein
VRISRLLATASVKFALDNVRTKQEHRRYRNQKSAEMERKCSFRVGRGTREQIMLTVFATLTFLIALWLCATTVAAMLEQSGSKIITVLKGQSLLATASAAPIKLRVSQRYPSTKGPLRAMAELRAAA